MLCLGTSDYECQQECRYQCSHEIRSPGFSRSFAERHERAARWATLNGTVVWMRAAPTSCRLCRVDPMSGEVVATNASLLAVYDHTQRKKEAFVTSNRVEFELTPELSATLTLREGLSANRKLSTDGHRGPLG